MSQRTLRLLISALALDLCGCAPAPEEGEQVELAITIDPTATYTLVGVQSKKCVQIRGDSTVDGAPSEIASCNGRASQQFRFESTGSGYYRLRNVGSSKCLDVEGASTSAGARIIQWPCGSGTNQQWRTADIAGAVQLLARHSNQAMDVSGASTADGTPVIQWPSSGSTNQQFQLLGAAAGTGDAGAATGTPVARWGALRVCGTSVCSSSGTPVQLKGQSSMWLNWEGTYSVNKSAMQWMRDNWNLSVFRAAMGVEPSGAYLSDPARMKTMVNTIVQNAIDLGVYVIVDWHDHNAQDHRSQAVSFFSEMATKWGGYPNVIWEDFNEPLNVSWSNTLKPYHQAVVSAIRQRDEDNLIVLGTPNWSQYVDQAANDPLSGSNLLYTLHFYSCSHTQWLRDRANTARSKGLALFVTEWGATHADGGLDGRVCLDEAQRWHDWMNANGIGWAAWKLDDCSDSSCILRPGAPAGGGWTDTWLHGHGPFVRDRMRQ
jgi:hypothetical protein